MFVLLIIVSKVLGGVSSPCQTAVMQWWPAGLRSNWVAVRAHDSSSFKVTTCDRWLRSPQKWPSKSQIWSKFDAVITDTGRQMLEFLISAYNKRKSGLSVGIYTLWSLMCFFLNSEDGREPSFRRLTSSLLLCRLFWRWRSKYSLYPTFVNTNNLFSPEKMKTETEHVQPPLRLQCFN